MSRNNPEQRKKRMQASLHRATECLDSAQVASGSESFLDQTRTDLLNFDDQLKRRDTLDPRVTVVAVAGPSGTGKSTVVNTLARSHNLVPTGTHRPTTQEIIAYVDADIDGTPFLELSGISRSISVEFCAADSKARPELRPRGEAKQVTPPQNNHLIVVEVPDTLLLPELTSRAAQVLETADLILWTTDCQKYADVAFHTQISAFPHLGNAYFVLTHTERLTETQRQTLNQELITIAQRLEVSTQILPISIYDDSSLLSFRETVEELSRAPRARWQGEQAAIRHTAARLCRNLELEQCAEPENLCIQSQLIAPSSSPAEADLVDRVAQVSGLAAVEANASKQYMQAGGFWTLWPVLSWLAGIKPLAPVSRDASTTPGEPAADEPSIRSEEPCPEETARDSQTSVVVDSSTDSSHTSVQTDSQTTARNWFSPYVNAAGITSTARAYAVAASAERPPKWVDFAQLQAAELSENLVSALNMALESWKFSARPARTWWRLWRCGHWFWLAVLLIGLLWSLIAGVVYLGGAGTSAAGGMVGAVPLPLVVLGTAILGTLGWSLVGARLLRCGAQNYSKECAGNFYSLILEVTRQAFGVKMNQTLDLYPQLSELVSEIQSAPDAQSD